MLLNSVKFHAPSTLKEAVELNSSLQNLKILAGGTFVVNSLKLQKRKGITTPDHILSLSNVKDLKGIEMRGDRLIIKSMTTIDELFESVLLADNFAILKKVCRDISTQPIRNMATVGGNLTCRYTWTEMPASMIGLSADMHFIGQDGKETIVSAENFFAGLAKTDKIFTHVSIKRDPACRISYQRVKKTQFVDIPLFSLMLNAIVSDNKFLKIIVSINNCVNFAQRDKQLETFLQNRKIHDTIAEEALDHLIESIYDTRSSDYKKHMFRVCIKKAVKEIAGLP